MNERIELTQDLVDRNFLPGNFIEPGWTFINRLPTEEQKHRAVIGVLEALVGFHSRNNTIKPGFSQVEYAYDHAAGYNKNIGRFAIVVNRDTIMTITALTLL